MHGPAVSRDLPDMEITSLLSHVTHLLRESCDSPATFPQPSQQAYVIDPDITPLLRLGVSTCQLCFVRVLKEEVLEQQYHVGEVLLRLPSILLHWVSQPFYQVLHPSSHLLDI